MSAKLKIVLSYLLIPGTIAILAAMDFGCTSSSLTNEWRDPEFKNPPMTNMFIVAGKRDPVNRRLWEDEITAELTTQGVKAIPSYRLFADSIPNPIQIGTAIKENKFDGVLFIRRLPTEISTNYVPGPLKTVQETKYDRHNQTYFTVYREVQDSGYTDTNRTVRQEISVFAPQQESGHLVWDGIGELINPSSRDEFRQEISNLIVPELARQGIIPGK